MHHAASASRQLGAKLGDQRAWVWAFLIQRLGLCRGGREHAVKLDRLATHAPLRRAPRKSARLMARGMVERLNPVPVRPRQVLAAASHCSLRHRLAI